MAEFNRTQNAARNLVFGAFLKVYNLVLPFILRTCMIYFMGVEYLGLSGLFASILQVLNLVELGVGSAMVYSMYKPIAQDDYPTLCALMNLYRKYYRIIGVVIGVVGLALTPAIPYLVTGDVPAELSLLVLYWMNLGLTVLSYWLFAYKSCLLQAYQRADVISKVSLATNTFLYAAQLVVILVVKDYYWYVIVALAAQVLTNVVSAICATRMFPHLQPKGNLSADQVKTINGRVRDLFTSKIGAVVMNAADTLVVSAFLGLTMLAIYQNYYFVVTAVSGFVGLLFAAALAGVGNSLEVESPEKNYRDLCKFTYATAWIAGVCTCCMLGLYQPFMELWVGQGLMLELGAVICFCIYFFVFQLNALLNMYKDAGGIWRKDRFRPLVVSLVNLGLNLLTVQAWGVYGVLLSTVVACIFVGEPWLLINLFTTMFSRENLVPYVKRFLLYCGVALVACGLCYGLCALVSFASLWLTLGVRLVICLAVGNGVFALALGRMDEFTELLVIGNSVTRGRVKLLTRRLERRGEGQVD